MSKFIFVTGGVISGLGKGVSAASLGRLLKSKGYSIFVQKLDPYLNVDPGTMSPYQHGEVYVTADGAETDLDLGHYERFIGEEFTKESNYTSGQIYSKVLAKERRGGFGGQTVQVIPHITSEIESIILNAAKHSKADFVITEIGGTVGDIESQAFIHAIAELSIKKPKDVFFIHVSYIPYLNASKEFKTKPTQHSIATLRSYGIKPDMLILRSHKKLSSNIKEKVSKVSLLNIKNIMAVYDAKSIYSIPKYLNEQKMSEIVLKKFGMVNKKANLDDWNNFIKLIKKDKKYEVNIAMVGKYVEYEDAYLSIIEALKISSYYGNAKLNLNWISSAEITSHNIRKKIEGNDSILVLPGFGVRGFEGKIVTARFARKNKIPIFGICYGMQAMVVEQARKNGIKDATSSENSPAGTHVIDIIRGKNSSDDMGGTLRLGNYETKLTEGSLAQRSYEANSVVERHRHRFEVNPEFVDQLQKDNFIFSGFDAINNLAEICELTDHPFYLGTQYHPEFTANPLKESKLFAAFLKATIENSNK